MDNEPSRNRPDWDSFETYKGPEESQLRPGRFRFFILTFFVIVVCSAMIFVLGGTLGSFLVARSVSRSRPPVQLNWERTFCTTGGISVLLAGAWVVSAIRRGGSLRDD